MAPIACDVFLLVMCKGGALQLMDEASVIQGGGLLEQGAGRGALHCSLTCWVWGLVLRA
jgi:hypothetical protein